MNVESAIRHFENNSVEGALKAMGSARGRDRDRESARGVPR